jgi:hypothetical protein
MAQWHNFSWKFACLSNIYSTHYIWRKKENRLKFAVMQQAEADNNAMKLILTSGEL